MSVAKISEISSSSSTSFSDAVGKGVERANETLNGITGAWVKEMKVDVTDGKIDQYRVTMKVTFVLND